MYKNIIGSTVVSFKKQIAGLLSPTAIVIKLTSQHTSILLSHDFRFLPLPKISLWVSAKVVYCKTLKFREHFISAQIRESARFAKIKCSRKFSASPELSKTFYVIKIG